MKSLFLSVLCLSLIVELRAQSCDPLISPTLFGRSLTAIYCKNIPLDFGVSNSTFSQVYDFSVKKANGGGVSRRSGPLDGNGDALSVTLSVSSAADAGQYIVTASNACGDAGSVSYEVFYGSIDNLSISAWGSNAVSFNWNASGELGAVTYDYAVTTISDPDSPSITFDTTSTTSASVSGLESGTTYYIYVRVNSVIWNNQEVQQSSDCPGGDLPWSTLRFISCSGAASTGTISPANAVACIGSSTTFTATGGNTYKWYQDNNSTPIAGATSSTYMASTPGEYKVYITTNAGCEGMTKTATLTQSSIQTGVFSGGGCFNIGDSVKLAISKTIYGQTYNILKDGAVVKTLQGVGTANESKDTVFYSFKLISNTQYGHYTVRTSNAYCAALNFGDQSVTAPGTWTGTSDTNWQNPSNWNCGSVPDANTNIIIPSGVAHMPSISGNVSCKSIVVQQGASLKVLTGFKLTVTGK